MRQHVADVLAIQPRGALLLGGHSLGGTLAVEEAFHFEAMGRTVGMVCLIGSS